jgi:hypothetical protein
VKLLFDNPEEIQIQLRGARLNMTDQKTAFRTKVCTAGLLIVIVACDCAGRAARGQNQSDAPSPPAANDSEPAALDRTDLIRQGVAQLIAMQEEGGQWPYEGVYRVARELPIGYRVGGTAIVGGTLLYAAPADNASAAAAIDRATDFVVTGLDHPLMRPSVADVYDVRVWGHAYALEYFCMLRAAQRTGEQDDAIRKWIPRLIDTLIEEEIPGGGWNYANHRATASFVTAPVVQALLLARSQKEKVPEDVLERAKGALLKSRTEEGAFLYSGAGGASARANVRAKLPGSIARSAICETTLSLLGAGSTDAIRASIAAFHAHWDELEKRRQKSGTHEGPYQIAPYYFYYGHRYVAQAIEMLPAAERPAERERLLAVILKTRDADGTWNDRVFPRSKNYGTAMIVLALLGERAPRPADWDQHQE